MHFKVIRNFRITISIHISFYPFAAEHSIWVIQLSSKMTSHFSYEMKNLIIKLSKKNLSFAQNKLSCIKKPILIKKTKVPALSDRFMHPNFINIFRFFQCFMTEKSPLHTSVWIHSILKRLELILSIQYTQLCVKTNSFSLFQLCQFWSKDLYCFFS